MRWWPGNSNDILLRSLQVLAALFAGYFICYPITDGDIFWHLAAGREMIARHTLFYSDPLSYTTSGTRWINPHWLFQVIMYMLQTAGGYRLLLTVKGIVVAGAAWLTFTAFPRATATAAAALGAAAVVYCQRYLIPLRPITATLLLISLFIASFERYCRSGRLRSLLPVLIGQVIWVNCQGLFMLGPMIAAAYGIGEWFNQLCARRFPRHFICRIGSTSPRCRPLLVGIPVLLALSLINPYGWRAFGFALKLFTRINPSASNLYAQTITENMPLLQMVGTGYSAYVLIIVAIAAATAVSILCAPSTVRFSHAALAAAGLLLAWMAQRNGILFTFLALPALLWNVHQASLTLSQRAGSVVRTIASTAAVLFAGCAVVNHTRLLLLWPHALSPFSHPTETAELMKQNPLPGRVFNADRYGGYLLWRLYPPLQVSHDTRLTLRSGAFFREYLTLTENPGYFNDYARTWGITQVVLPVAPIDRYLPLAAALYRDPGWKLAFTDGAEVLFVADTMTGFKGIDLDSLPAIDAITMSLGKRFGQSPTVHHEALFWLGRWCEAAGAHGSARKIFLLSKNRPKDFP
jgi:hypothetical protein